MSEKKAKILIIDDQPSEVKMVKMALEQANYEVCYAYNGKEGLQKAAQEKPDLIILDVMMPEKDGFITCGELKKSSETSEVSKTAPKAVKAAPEPFVEKSPCMFTIVDNGDGTISARSRKGDIFKGTRAEFNARLRV